MTHAPMTMASRDVTIRDFLIFQLKLFLDGFKDFAAMWLSTGAIILDFIAGRGRRPRLFYSVVRASERFDKWLNLHGVVERLDASDTDDGLFGVSEAGSDTLVGQLEQLLRGGDLPRGVRPALDPRPGGPARGASPPAADAPAHLDRSGERSSGDASPAGRPEPPA